jgi:hypothetical protein
MRHVAPPLAELTAQAQSLTSAGDLAGARAVLADVLDPADADPRRASPDLALAAALQARILVGLGDPHAARTWAGFAHVAEERLHGPRDERTVAAAATHAAVLHRIGNHGRAAQLYHELVSTLTALDGRLSPRVLAAEADLATAEHAAGHCTAARARLADVWVRHREVYGDASAAGIKMLARLGAMERECGRDGDAQEHLMQAQEMCARYLPADHPLAQQVARLAGSPVSGRHLCGRVQRSTGPTSGGPAPGDPALNDPASNGPAPNGPAPNGPAPNGPAPGDPASTGPIPSSPISSGPTSGGPASHGPASHGSLSSGPTSGGPAWGGPASDGPAWGGPAWGGPAPGVTRVPAAVQSAVPGVTPVPWEQPAPGDLTGRHARAEPPIALPLTSPAPNPPSPAAPEPAPNPPSPAAPEQDAQEATAPGERLPPQAWSVEPPGPFPPDSFPPAAYPPDAYPPGPRLPRQPVDRAVVPVPSPDRRLPVPVPKPDSPHSKQPLLLAAVLVAGIAAAAAVVAATLPQDDAGPTPAPQAGARTVTSAPPSVAPSPSPVNAAVAPAGVTLRDNRDSVSLSWRYPKGSEGPVLISGGRVGQEQRAFQELAAGTTEYVVYGLNKQNNYCFTVAVVYTVDQVAASKAVCTSRN